MSDWRSCVSNNIDVAGSRCATHLQRTVRWHGGSKSKTKWNIGKAVPSMHVLRGCAQEMNLIRRFHDTMSVSPPTALQWMDADPDAAGGPPSPVTPLKPVAFNMEMRKLSQRTRSLSVMSSKQKAARKVSFALASLLHEPHLALKQMSFCRNPSLSCHG